VRAGSKSAALRVAGAHFGSGFVGEHSSILREWFSISTRLCASMSHISDPERIFPHPSRWSNFPQPFPFGHPALFGRYEIVCGGELRGAPFSVNPVG
jgi:hypothetical protein